jgi:hypothetical protein
VVLIHLDATVDHLQNSPSFSLAEGLAADPAAKYLEAVDTSGLIHELNPSTGSSTPISSSAGGVGRVTNDMNGKLYACKPIDGSSCQLGSFSVSTRSSFIPIGSPIGYRVTGLVAITWAPFLYCVGRESSSGVDLLFDVRVTGGTPHVLGRLKDKAGGDLRYASGLALMEDRSLYTTNLGSLYRFERPLTGIASRIGPLVFSNDGSGAGTMQDLATIPLDRPLLANYAPWTWLLTYVVVLGALLLVVRHGYNLRT